MKRFLCVFGFFALCVFLGAAQVFAAALTTGATYTVEVDAIGSDGSIVDLGFSTSATADADGKIAFSFSGLPTRDDYNFLLISIIDPADPGNPVRRSIVPAPEAGGEIDLGVSPMTESQTEAMLQAMDTANTDDPVMLLFGSIIIRSGGFGAAEITHLANLGRLAIKGPNGDDTVAGFNFYLIDKVGEEKFAAFKAAIVSMLGDYTSKLKEAVEAADDASSADVRAEAAAFLSQILIDAAEEADFDVEYINAAMDACSDQVEIYLGGDGATMDETAILAMDSVMSANYMKLKAEKVRQKYTAALTTLGASQEQIDRLNAAITNLSDAMIEAFQTMEQVFAQEDASIDAGDAAAIEAASADMNTAMQAAFDTFQAESAATNDEIDDMVDAMQAAFAVGDYVEMDLNAMKDPNDDDDYSDGMFTFWTMNGDIYNWPITMVVPVTWLANNHSDDFSYTRQSDVGEFAFPAPAAMQWLDSDNNPGNGMDGLRHDFEGEGFGMPPTLAGLFGLREDIEIINARKWAGEVAASSDMTQAGYDSLSVDDQAEADVYVDDGDLEIIEEEDTAEDDDLAGVDLLTFDRLNDLSPYLTSFEKGGLEDLYLQRIEDRKDAITSTDVENPITDEQKQALVDTATMPSF